MTTAEAWRSYVSANARPRMAYADHRQTEVRRLPVLHAASSPNWVRSDPVPRRGRRPQNPIPAIDLHYTGSTDCFIDTETTGLDARIHQPYEVCYWREDQAKPQTAALPHSLNMADAAALRIGGYFDRDFRPETDRNDYWVQHLARALNGVTLVGSNPAFDAAMLTRFIGAPVWHHRMIDVSAAGMWVFDTDRPEGLAGVADRCRDAGYEIPAPDHTAEGDVRTTRAVYEALRAIRGAA